VSRFSLRNAVNGDIEMTVQTTKLEAAENDLKQLMADVARAMEKTQQAVARITGKTTATSVEAEATASSRWR
jgi:hypothetical protein